MTPLGRLSIVRPIPLLMRGQTLMISEFTTDPGKDGGYTIDDSGAQVRVTHPELRAALLFPWSAIAFAEESRPPEPAAVVPSALGEVLAPMGKAPPENAIVDPAGRAAHVDGIPAALQPPMGSETVPSYVSAERAASMSQEQLDALKADGAQILPPNVAVSASAAAPSGSAPKGDYPGKKRP